MKLRDLRHGTSPTWPPGWGGSYGRGDTFARGAVGILKAAEPLNGERGVRITIEFEGNSHSGTMLWDGDKPSANEVVAALHPRIGTEVANLSAVDVC
jgi:hypothetical protein